MEPKLPIAADALDLYMEIDGEIAEAWVAAFREPPNADKPETLLAQWSAWADPDTHVYLSTRTVTAGDLIASWEQKIDTFFNPPRSAELNVPCPVCETRYIYRSSAGEEVRASAMSFTRDRISGQTIDARCSSCGAVWAPGEFDRLAALIGIDVEAKKRRFAEGEDG